MIRTPTTLKENEVEKDKGSPVVIMLYQNKEKGKLSNGFLVLSPKNKKEIFSMARMETQYHPYTNFYFDYEKNQDGKATGTYEAKNIFKKQEKKLASWIDESKGAEDNKLTFGYWVTATGEFLHLNVLENTKPLLTSAAHQGAMGAAADVDWFDEVTAERDWEGKKYPAYRPRDMKGWTIWTDFIGKMRTDDIIKLNDGVVGIVGVGDEAEDDQDEDEEYNIHHPDVGHEPVDVLGPEPVVGHEPVNVLGPEPVVGHEPVDVLVDVTKPETKRTLLVEQNPNH